MGSEAAATATPSGTATRKKQPSARRSSGGTAPRSPSPTLRAVRVDTATVSPTAVMDMRADHTGMTS